MTKCNFTVVTSEDQHETDSMFGDLLNSMSSQALVDNWPTIESKLKRCLPAFNLRTKYNHTISERSLWTHYLNTCKHKYIAIQFNVDLRQDGTTHPYKTTLYLSMLADSTVILDYSNLFNCHGVFASGKLADLEALLSETINAICGTFAAMNTTFSPTTVAPPIITPNIFMFSDSYYIYVGDDGSSVCMEEIANKELDKYEVLKKCYCKAREKYSVLTVEHMKEVDRLYRMVLRKSVANSVVIN